MILVTGGTGLVGAHLLLHLVENEASIRAIYRTQNTLDKTIALFKLHKKENHFNKIEWVQADIVDVPSLETVFHNIDSVYHCAGFISFNPKDENLHRKINIEGTANIVNFCIDKKVKKLCHVSSIATLGDLNQNETVFSEISEWNPDHYHCDYAISKYGAEMEVWRGFQEGLSVVIVNPGVILGATIWKEGSGAIFDKVKKGFPFYTKGVTAYVGVNDVVKIMMQLMNSTINGERFSIVSENCSYKNVMETIATKFDLKVPNIHIKPWLTNIIWRFDWFLATFLRTKRFISKHAATTIHTIDIYSNEKIKTTLNYNFQSIEEVINEIIALEKQ